MNKKYYLASGIGLAAILLFFASASIYLNWQYGLKISIDPPDSHVYIDSDEFFTKTPMLKRGDYELSFKKNGYVDKKISINIPKQKKINITLDEKPELNFDTQGFLSVNMKETKIGLVGIDKITGNLMEYSDGASPRIIYQGKVRRWSNNYPWIVVLDEKTKTMATVLNVVDNTKKNIISPSGKNIEAATIGGDGHFVYLLTNSSPLTRKSDLIKIDLVTKINAVILQTDATTLDVLQNNQLLLVAEADGELASVCRIINLSDSQQTMSWKANYCVVNDNKDSILVAGQTAIIYNAITEEPYDTEAVGDVAWSSNLPIIVRRTKDGVIVNIYENGVIKKNITLPIINYQKLIGATDTHLTLRLLDGQISSYLLK
ncbi:MAG: hypothetical protein WAV40_03055 [Microgenomates group bacterium]